METLSNTMIAARDDGLPFTKGPARKLAEKVILSVMNKLAKEGKYDELNEFLDDLAQTPIDQVTEKASNYLS